MALIVNSNNSKRNECINRKFLILSPVKEKLFGVAHCALRFREMVEESLSVCWDTLMAVVMSRTTKRFSLPDEGSVAEEYRWLMIVEVHDCLKCRRSDLQRSINSYLKHRLLRERLLFTLGRGRRKEKRCRSPGTGKIPWTLVSENEHERISLRGVLKDSQKDSKRRQGWMTNRREVSFLQQLE